MTDNKRFELDEYGHINDTLQEIIYDGGEDCVYMLKLLNTLNDENEELKQEIEGNISSFKENNRKRLELEKENEQLKSENKELQIRYKVQKEFYGQLNSDFNNLRRDNQDLKKENEYLTDDFLELKEENCILQKENKELKKELITGKEYCKSLETDLRNCAEARIQLQERNNRQAKQLDNLYQLIEKEDWKALKNIINDFKESEKLIKKEWECY